MRIKLIKHLHCLYSFLAFSNNGSDLSSHFIIEHQSASILFKKRKDHRIIQIRSYYLFIKIVKLRYNTIRYILSKSMCNYMSNKCKNHAIYLMEICIHLCIWKYSANNRYVKTLLFAGCASRGMRYDVYSLRKIIIITIIMILMIYINNSKHDNNPYDNNHENKL